MSSRRWRCIASSRCGDSRARLRPPESRRSCSRARRPRCSSVRRARASPMVWSSSARSGATSSAAAEGVGARRSATKSAMVKSVSWPTPLTTGKGLATMARARASSLKAHRSSMLPPPRISRMTSTSSSALSRASAARNCRGRLQALHGGRAQPDLGQREATPQHVADVLKGGGLRRGHHANHPREGRQRPFAPGVEEAFGLQRGLQGLEPCVEVADANGSQHRGVELVLPARLVNADVAEGLHGVALLRHETLAGRGRTPHDAAQAGAGVLEREVPVAGAGARQVRNLPADGHVLQLHVAFQQQADTSGDFGDGPGAGHAIPLSCQDCAVYPAHL